MRNDALGFFWQDEAPVRTAKVKVKCVPPDPIWTRPNYLPGLKEAIEFNVPLMTDDDLWLAALAKEEMIFDCECYPNYFLAAFKSVKSGKVTFVESYPGKALDIVRLEWLLKTFVTVGFNNRKFDNPLCAVALAGKTLGALKQFTDMVIVEKQQPYNVLRTFKIKQPYFNSIDLLEVAPLSASLKVYAGRIHCRKMQDLPFDPNTTLSWEQIAIVRYYCVNDLENTALLYDCLKPQIELRASMSEEFDLDLRSKSDAQIAEAVIASELYKLTGQKPKKPQVMEGHIYRYSMPQYIHYQTPTLQWVKDRVAKAEFVVNKKGKVILPRTIAGMDIPIAGTVYRLGQGGLHSKEKKQAVVSTDSYKLEDHDVISYYPSIILNLGLYPVQLGPAFLTVYRQIVLRRIAAKAAEMTVIADSLKIVINGSFGKFGNMFSIIYAPQLLIQTTITGQLALLMLIEAFELNNIRVVSANTDGVVTYAHVDQEALVGDIIKWWENVTQFKMEHTPYRAIYSRDVNNYIAVKPDGKVKTKGVYYNPYQDKDKSNRLKKNPAAYICSNAISDMLTKGTSIEASVRGCTNFNDFLFVKKVAGGGYKDGEFLGKAIRWYYSTKSEGPILYALKGSKVSVSDGGRPQMELPDELPDDIDYEKYISVAEGMLRAAGCNV